MTSTFEWTTFKGAAGKIIATYAENMEMEAVDADGDIIELGIKPTTAGKCDMKAYIGEELVDSCWNHNFWGLIDVSGMPDVKKIWGLDIGLNLADADRYEKWLDDLIAGGTSSEAKKYHDAESAKQHAKEIADAKAVVAKAESQRDIPDRSEARRRENVYNDINNEGGDGYVPHWVSREEYDAAKAILGE